MRVSFSDIPTSQRHENRTASLSGGAARQNVWTFSYICANRRTRTSVIDSSPFEIGGKEIDLVFTTISKVAVSAKARGIRYGRFSSFARMYVAIQSRAVCMLTGTAVAAETI